MTVQEQTEKRMRNELQLITKEFMKVETIMNDKNIPFQKKQLIDPDKWRKKFRFLFDREKCLNFDLTDGSHIFAKKGIVTNLEPKSTKALGKYVLEECANFWILFAYYNRSKIDGDIDQKEKVRRQVVDTFFENPAKHAQQVVLKKWLDNILYLPEISTAACVAQAQAAKEDATPASATASHYSHMFQSHIGSNLREIQQEEEIIFFDDVKAFGGFGGSKGRPSIAEADVTFTDVKIEKVQAVEKHQEKTAVEENEVKLENED